MHGEVYADAEAAPHAGTSPVAAVGTILASSLRKFQVAWKEVVR